MVTQSINRIDYLDIAKGILILLMVSAHVYQDCYFYDFVYSFHMMSFFFISGLVLNYSSALKKPYIEVLKGKFKTMVIPFAFFETLGILRDILRGYNLSVFGFLYNTVTLHFNNGILWFLFTIFFAELLFILLVKTIHRRQFLVILSILLLIITFFIPQRNEVMVYCVRIPRAVFFLCMGYYLKSLFSKQHIYTAFICIAIVAALSYLHFNVEFTTSGIQYFPVYIINSFCGIYFILNISMYSFWGEWVKKIGENSLAIYGTHSLYYVVFGFWLGIKDFTAITFWHGALVLLLVVIAEIPTVALLSRFTPFLIGKKR